MKRFDENFTELDGALLREAINECDKDGEWPVALRKTILPYSLMTKELLTGKGRQKGLLDLEEPVHFDLVIIDELTTFATRIQVLTGLHVILQTMQMPLLC